MTPVIEFEGLVRSATLEVKGNVIATLDTLSGDVTLLVDEANEAGRLRKFRREVNEIRGGEARDEGSLRLESDHRGEAILNSRPVFDRERVAVKEKAFLSVIIRPLLGEVIHD